MHVSIHEKPVRDSGLDLGFYGDSSLFDFFFNEERLLP
jgi:hypothetical protein